MAQPGMPDGTHEEPIEKCFFRGSPFKGDSRHHLPVLFEVDRRDFFFFIAGVEAVEVAAE